MSASNSTNSTTPTTTDPEKQTQEIDERAWKHIGYPGFCEFSAIDDDFLLLRRFGALNIRVLLDLQFQITQLEVQLCDLDQGCRDDTDLESAASRMDSLAWDNSEHNERRRRGELVLSTLSSFMRIKEQDTATSIQRRNVQRWFADHINAVDEEEQNYIKRVNDLMTLARA
ncbi:hypothetical protein NA57DRAFT_59023 [Rhizodiscina lignyota]|uniref:DUF6594 domain-containing protein n=1 Tax=Rhizodiscina lignyota TaxID=1504668 RepID=A0A9P4I6M4_9PEZI|nr:hypothetical protein NA57DRAFT_59023 [Rhizodiscina lignyota]